MISENDHKARILAYQSILNELANIKAQKLTFYHQHQWDIGGGCSVRCRNSDFEKLRHHIKYSLRELLDNIDSANQALEDRLWHLIKKRQEKLAKIDSAE